MLGQPLIKVQMTILRVEAGAMKQVMNILSLKAVTNALMKGPLYLR